MGFKCGIIGLPNVGKSTLFNVLTQTQAAQAANYPFCTIEPNIGNVSVPDERLATLAAIAQSAKIIPTQLTFVDIAGLVRGAAQGEGLGNRFLANIREVDAIAHVLRCFDDDDIQHVNNKIDPLADVQIIETELLLADLESLEKRVPALLKKASGGDKAARIAAGVLGRARDLLSAGRSARHTEVSNEEEARILHEAQLLTTKPMIYIANVDEASAREGNDYSASLTAQAQASGLNLVLISAAIEADLIALPPDERADYMSALDMSESGLDRIIRAGYDLLDLISFFTVGPKECRAWTVRQGACAPEAAGCIHSDMQRGFIRAETISYADYTALGGEAAAREAGKMRQEGKDYIVQDGDILHIKFNV